MRLPSAPVGSVWTLNTLRDTTGWLCNYTFAKYSSSPYSAFLNPKIMAPGTVPADSVKYYFWMPTQAAAQAWLSIISHLTL